AARCPAVNTLAAPPKPRRRPRRPARRREWRAGRFERHGDRQPVSLWSSSDFPTRKLIHLRSLCRPKVARTNKYSAAPRCSDRAACVRRRRYDLFPLSSERDLVAPVLSLLFAAALPPDSFFAWVSPLAR